MAHPMIHFGSNLIVKEPLRTLIADDEPPALNVLRRFVEEDERLTLVGEASNGFEVVDLVSECAPELLLLDIEMPGLDGLGAVESLARPAVKMPLIVFTTAFEDYAIRAFELSVVDYLLKPFDRVKFGESIRRACFFAALLDSLDRVGPSTYADSELSTFFVRSQDRMLPVEIQEIMYFEADGNIVMGTTNEKRFVVDRSLKELSVLLGDLFFRANRSMLANKQQVRRYERHDTRRIALIMNDDCRIVASKRRSRWIRHEILAGPNAKLV